MSDPAELLKELAGGDDDDAAVEVVAEALAEGDESDESLAARAAAGEPALRRAALLALGQRRAHAQGARIEASLADDVPAIRAAACRALGLLGAEEPPGALLRALADRHPAVRGAAAEALGSLGGERAFAALEAALARERSAEAWGPLCAALARAGRGAGLVRRGAALLARAAARQAEGRRARSAAAALCVLTQEAPYADLLAALREVPGVGREALADAIEGCGAPIAPALARLLPQLRERVPDPEVVGRYGVDLSRRAAAGALARAHGRDELVEAVLERLSRPGPRSVVLVGPPGVGKTAVVHEVVRRLAEQQVLSPAVVLEATTGEVLSGTRFLGEWQTRLKELVSALAPPARAVWYVPDVDRLVDAGTSSHSDESFAGMLAPHLERGTLAIVGESTPQGIRRGLERNQRLARLFLRVDVQPTSATATLEVLERVGADLAQEFRASGTELCFEEGVFVAARDLAEDHLPGPAAPGNAVTLLREAAQGARGGRTAPAPTRVRVGPRQVLEALSRFAGVPLRLLDDSLPLDLGEVRRFFAERVLGQDAAVETVVDLIGLIKAGLTDPARPLGVLFFVGPTGVGKTEMAKALAQFIFGSAERLVRIDLGEFRDPVSLRRLVGDPHAAEPAARTGLLTAPVRERPFSVVLLDEVEKAHSNVFDLLLPLMDEGRLVDEQGRVTDFRRSIVIMTSNLGSDLAEDAWLGFGAPATEGRRGLGEKVRRVMEETFRPEFLNRLSKVVLFAPLSHEVMRRLARREVRRVLSRRGITRRRAIIETDDSIIGVLLQEGFSPRYGARPLKRRVEDLLLRPLARALLALRPDEEAVVRLGVSGQQVVSEIVHRPGPEEALDDGAPPERRVSARVRDPRRGRLVSVDELEERALELEERVEGLVEVLERQGLPERKSHLVQVSQAAGFWDEPERARRVTSEIAAIEQSLEAPRKLLGRLEALEGLFEAARRQRGESRALYELLVRLDELGDEVELAGYAARCTSPVERGEAYLHLRLVGEGSFPRDPIAALHCMYRAYARRKRGFSLRVVYESVDAEGRVVEAGLRVSGLCAFAFLRGEDGLHHWLQRSQRRTQNACFVRVSVFPPAAGRCEVRAERRFAGGEGVLLRRHRQHLVLTHPPTLLAVDGAVDAEPGSEEEARAFLAARVARSGGHTGEGGLVRRYILSSQPVCRDLFTGLRLPLDPVLAGKLDPLVLPRLAGGD
ncbi:MAG: AAA family ATPase [Planctomycetota bacterium]|nr:MAG: AAA family ATPase [Planctomycetota bacterium]